MIFKVLVAIDSSESSLKGYQAAFFLAKQSDETRYVVFKSLEDEWQASLFEPFYFTENLDLTITPRDDIPDARLISESSIGTRTEFDPNQPKTMVSFSWADDIGQTLFPNFGLTIVNRLKISEHASLDYARRFLALICERQPHGKRLL
jgi:hypothetical protein